MEKFAEQYTLQNEDVFPSADTCFILAFAVIMLQTDLHSPNIKPEKKMTQEAFLNMNRGISVDGGDLPSDFLIDLYLSIKKRPFTLKEDDDARNHQKKNEETGFNDVFFGTAAEERRRVLYKKERAELVESTEKLFKKQKGGSAIEHEFTSSVDPSDVVKPMYDITWGPLLGALSQILEKAEDDTSIALCLNGFVYAIRVASHTNTTLARRTFVNSLAKFTALGSIRELKSRNIECIRTLLSIAIMDGEKLGDSWMPILQCISQLSRLSFFGSGVDSNDDFLNSDAQSTKSLQSSETRETEEINGRVVLEAIHEILIEKVFSSTTKLSDKGVLDIIECLVNVSISEIEGDSKKGITGVGRSVRSLGNSDKTDISRKGSNTVVDGPRVFSLQKLLEVADYNMNSRSRLSWAKIWELMANHFVVIGCHDNAMVSMFAIDGLRQLSFKFLEKPELADFNFQRLFLQPFLAIISNPNTLADTRELILQCVDNTIRSLSHNLRSGWRVFFAILSHSANDASVGNSSLGLSILQRLVDCHLDDFCAALKDENRSVDDGKEEDVQDKELSASEVKEQRVHVEDFIGLCGASLAFIETEKELPMALSMRALCHVACYADRIAEGKVLPPLCSTQSSDRTLPGYTYDGLSPKEGREMILWRLIFDGLARGLRSSVSCSGGGVGCFVQRGSVMTLRSILLRHGTCFSANQWKVIMNCSILPAIEMAAKSDTSPVMNIISESPTVSNLDFITEPQPLPPAVDDEGLRQFAEESKLDDRHHTSKRSMGHAELLVEASFVDLKHGGSGDLTQAYTLLRKAPIQKNIEEPFPNSWVATTAPIALGMLTDIFCLIASNYEAEEAKDLWPVTIGQMQKWAVGSPFGISSSSSQSSWAPCEALVRIGCKEISHLSDTVFTLFPSMEEEDVTMWLGFLCQNLAESLSHNIELERELHESVSREIKEINQVLLNEQTILSADDDERSLSFVHTQYGSGTLDGQRTDKYKDGNVTISIVKLESGATLYGTIDMKSSQDSNTMENELSSVAQLHSDSVDEGKISLT
jgi:brefeldin A-inhibited guanine nucleotide-exchange protein